MNSTTDMPLPDPESPEPAADRAGNLGEQAFQRIRTDILFYQLPPGARVSEASLTQRYGLRQAAVRSALLRLVQEGLVDKSDERSPRVAPLTLKDVRDIYGLRLLLEPRAAELAAVAGLSTAEFDRLRQISQCRYEVGSHDERVAFLNANREFTLLVAAKSGNARLQATITQLQDLTLRILYVGLGSLNVSDWFRDKHLQIVDAIEARDGARAAELWRIDLTYGERLVADALMNLPALSEVNLADGSRAR
jgi:DNA-binding GntR family transcriptional regulator